MQQYFFSIVIPTLNEEHYISKLLTDLTSQKKKNFEVVVVDAMSTDKTKEKVMFFKRDFPLKFVAGEKHNVAYSRNLGAENSSGKYLIFLDADARVKHSFSENLENDITKSSHLVFLPQLASEDDHLQHKMLFILMNAIIKSSYFIKRPLSTGGAIFIEKKLFQKIGGFNEELYISEDHNLIQKAYKLGFIPKLLANTPVVFSLRRVKKEGFFRVAYKYVFAAVYFLLFGDIKKKIFPYEMGGSAFEGTQKVPARED